MFGDTQLGRSFASTQLGAGTGSAADQAGADQAGQGWKQADWFGADQGNHQSVGLSQGVSAAARNHANAAPSTDGWVAQIVAPLSQR